MKEHLAASVNAFIQGDMAKAEEAFNQYIKEKSRQIVADSKKSVNESELPPNILADYEARAQAERDAGGKVEIDNRLPTVSVTMSDGSDYFFQEHEASDLLDEVPDNIAPEDYILAVAQGW